MKQEQQTGAKQESKRLETILLNENMEHGRFENYDVVEDEEDENVTYSKYASGWGEVETPAFEEHMFGDGDYIDMSENNVDYREEENEREFKLVGENKHYDEDEHQNQHQNEHQQQNQEDDCGCEDDDFEDDEFDCHCNPVNSGLTDVVDSIAHQENGLAKILDSESRKISKAIGIARSVDDLVRVNKSVQNTIKQVNNIQILLLGKLQEVSDICDGCDDDCGCN